MNNAFSPCFSQMGLNGMVLVYHGGTLPNVSQFWHFTRRVRCASAGVCRCEEAAADVATWSGVVVRQAHRERMQWASTDRFTHACLAPPPQIASALLASLLAKTGRRVSRSAEVGVEGEVGPLVVS